MDNIEEQILSLGTNRLARYIINTSTSKNINEVYQEIIEQELKNTSMDLDFFPNNIVLLYPDIKELHARKPITCDFSGAITKKGSLYLRYRPFIENISTNKRYVLKKAIRVEPAYYDMLPTTIAELERLNYYMKLEQKDVKVDYSHLYQVMGGQFVLKELLKKGRKK